MLRITPTVGGIYHVYNRGVEKREIFINDKDRLRFIHGLKIFNNAEQATNTTYFFDRSIEVGLRYKKVVKILAFVLMPNHYHLLLQQVTEDGITEFMRKLGTGYTNYFNKKYERVGPLFQGKFKSVEIKEQRHFIYLPYYIHLNPLALINSEQKNDKILKNKEALDFLENYPWSSHMDYLGKTNVPYILDMNFLNEVFGDSRQYLTGIQEWLNESAETEINDIILD